ncbi:thiol reductant ABC exporter subunit CydC [Clostridium sp. A1-XYC3]|uniref:Thiol reductant ABC exporter subunit CydC n=1 Tax=Clostridium tanneri TaxID=3037988 RepID=A0ABU4JWU4_9CLOT|nr:thiol reductant ABC exporter subunit CydC [Clostridium sp. A1-XYC3]MDW8802615.1 thiol reductant ABC exporter subunit CydC [Clostridium sp. A1-XYC3]
MRIFNLINYLMKKHIFFVIFSIFMGVLTIISNVGMLSTSSILISRAALHPEVLDLMVLIVAVRFFGISRGVFRYLERFFSHDTTFRVLSSTRRWVYKNFNDNYSEGHEGYKTGDIYTKIVKDVDVLKEFYLRGIYPLFIAILTGLVTVVVLSYFSIPLSIYYILFYIGCGFILPLALFFLSRRLIQKESQLKEELNLILLDFLKGVVEASIYSLKEEFNDKVNYLMDKLSEIEKKKNFINAVGDNLYSLALSLLVLLSLVITAPLIVEGRLEGIYYAMVPLSIMASFEALIPMTNVLYKFKEADNSGKNILSIIGIENKRGNNRENLNFSNNVIGKLTSQSSLSIDYSNDIISNCNLSVNNLSIYNSSKKFLIRDLSFNLPYGKKIAIVGTSGSGKSTVLRALLGFVNFHRGDIKIGGRSYSQLDKEEIRKFFTYVEQNSYIFNTTIRENLLIAKDKAEDAEIMEILRKCQIDTLIKELPDKLDTITGQYGFKISGGEKQRLLIGRALLKKSKIVLLDEPTASLDTKLEKKVVDFLHSSIKDKSCIWVTHRLISMDRMDEILVLNQGEVVERGTHKELLALKGRYYKLWSLQRAEA